MSDSGYQTLGPRFQAEEALAGANSPPCLGSWVGPSRRSWAHPVHHPSPCSYIAKELDRVSNLLSLSLFTLNARPSTLLEIHDRGLVTSHSCRTLGLLGESFENPWGTPDVLVLLWLWVAGWVQGWGVAHQHQGRAA